MSDNELLEIAAVSLFWAGVILVVLSIVGIVSIISWLL